MHFYQSTLDIVNMKFNVFYSAFTNVFYSCHFFTFFNVFYYNVNV